MNALGEEIAREIEREGPMTLARFMELALYAPGRGYYEGRRQIGRHGDFYTSVSVGSVFGELLAFESGAWLQEFPKPVLIEAGAHDGRLAADILGWTEQFYPKLFARLEYWLVEPSPARRQWQKETLKRWGLKARWLATIDELPHKSVDGVIFSNEFLDAFPVHRLAWSATEKKWREWHVIVEGDKLAWQLGSLSMDAASQAPKVAADLAAALPDQYAMEISPAALAWWRKAAERLRNGRLLTIDYGLTEEELFRPERREGTLRGYAGHRDVDDLLDNPGGQDLTAHVHFTALAKASGLQTYALYTQEKFFTMIFAGAQKAPESFPPWTEQRLRQFKTLVHPQLFGRTFRVFVQRKEAH